MLFASLTLADSLRSIPSDSQIITADLKFESYIIHDQQSLFDFIRSYIIETDIHDICRNLSYGEIPKTTLINPIKGRPFFSHMFSYAIDTYKTKHFFRKLNMSKKYTKVFCNFIVNGRVENSRPAIYVAKPYLIKN